MDVVVELLWLAAIIAVIGVVAMKLWRNKAKTARFLLYATAVVAGLYLLGDELVKMAVWYFWQAAFMMIALPALVILGLIFRKRIKRLWARFTSWWKRTGTAVASLITLAVLFAVYLFFNGGVWLLPLVILGLIFKSRLSGAWVALRTAVRFP